MSALSNQFTKLIGDFNLGIYVDRVEETPYGLKYLWDGMMICHVVNTGQCFIDVQDRVDVDGDLSAFERYCDLPSLVRRIAESFMTVTTGTIR